MQPQPQRTPEELERLLVASSRTFALAIPLLPEPTREEVTIAYLLFRIADTFEDAAAWPGARRIEALERFAGLLEHPDPAEIREVAMRWAEEVPCEQPGYRELLAEIPLVFDEFFSLSPTAVELITAHTLRTARGMAGFVGRVTAEGEIRLESLADLRQYCYVVAGIVGELLTELFLRDRPALDPVAAALRERSRPFGEALQLVNILKDSAADATQGRRYLPEGVERADGARPGEGRPPHRDRLRPHPSEGWSGARPRRLQRPPRPARPCDPGPRGNHRPGRQAEPAGGLRHPPPPPPRPRPQRARGHRPVRTHPRGLGIVEVISR